MTEMSKLLQDRIDLIKEGALRAWAERMIHEWSKNEEMSLVIVIMAEQHEILGRLRVAAQDAPLFVETLRGDMKPSPLYRRINEVTTLLLSLSRRLNIDADIAFDGEEYE